jgi:ethanolamine transporter
MLKKLLARVKNGRQFDEAAVIGFITTIANAIPTMTNLKNMTPKGKMLNCAFLSCAAYALGDHLAYCSATASCLIYPMLATKLTGAVIATILAAIFWREK